MFLVGDMVVDALQHRQERIRNHTAPVKSKAWNPAVCYELRCPSLDVKLNFSPFIRTFISRIDPARLARNHLLSACHQAVAKTIEKLYGSLRFFPTQTPTRIVAAIGLTRIDDAHSLDFVCLEAFL